MSLEKGLYGLEHRLSPHAEDLDLHLLDLFERSHGPDIRIRPLAGKKLPRARVLEAALGIFTAGKGTRTGGEDGLLASFEVGVRDKEDELVAVRQLVARRHGCPEEQGRWTLVEAGPVCRRAYASGEREHGTGREAVGFVGVF